MMARLKRWLYPLRPVLGPIVRPIRRRVRTLVRDDLRSSIPNRLARAELRVERLGRRLLRRPPPALQPLRHVELLALAVAEPYYRARVGYLGAASKIARELIDRRGLRTALELGPYKQPLITGADVMDVRLAEGLQSTAGQVVHDARTVPWPIADKAYDLFVAFQVFEHLGNRQPEAFREVRRVARNAILSLPIDWEMADPRNCHHQLSEEKVRGWFAPVEPTRVVVGNPGHRKRLLFVFENLPPPDATADPTGTQATRPADASAADAEADPVATV
jgi:hypothetical protein